MLCGKSKEVAFYKDPAFCLAYTTHTFFVDIDISQPFLMTSYI